MMLRFQFRPYRLPFRMPVHTAHGAWTEREGVLIRLENGPGKHGYGEAAPVNGFGTETVAEVLAMCAAWPERLDVARLANVPTQLSSLRGAIAAARGGLESDDATPTPAAEDYRAMAALLPAGRRAIGLLRDQAAAGFRVFKWKVGVVDAADEWVMLDELCAELPEGARLRLDANGAWDRRCAERWLSRCAERPVEFVEQPVAPTARGADDLLQGLAADYPTALALDESLVTDGDVERWLGAGWSGIFVLKPTLLGDAAGTLAALAAAHARVVFSSALETAVGAQSALRHAFAWPGERLALGFGVWPLFEDTRFNGPTAQPFLRWRDVQRIDPESLWNALT